jgi:hypothetical protein
MSKTVFWGFIAAWFFAASPIKRSDSVKETKEGVVKLPCSLSTEISRQRRVPPNNEEDRFDRLAIGCYPTSIEGGQAY